MKTQICASASCRPAATTGTWRTSSCTTWKASPIRRGSGSLRRVTIAGCTRTSTGASLNVCKRASPTGPQAARTLRGSGHRETADRCSFMAITTIKDVEISRTDAADLLGCFVDAPKSGSAHDTYCIDLLGWVLGRSSPVKEVEVLSEGAVIRKAII